MGKSDYQYSGVLMEEINERLKLVQERLYDLPAIREDVRQIKADQTEMKQWREVCDLVVKDHSKTINIHESRLTKLETA